MTGDLALLEQQLVAKSFAGLQVFSRRFPGKDHNNVVPLVLKAGHTELFL